MHIQHRRTPAAASRGTSLERPGFTLVELLVALVLIQIGLLALVAAGGVAARQAATTRARTAAIAAAANRLQILGSGPCAATTGSTGQPPSVVERWSVDLMQNNIRDIRDSVTVKAAGATRIVALHTRFPC